MQAPSFWEEKTLLSHLLLPLSWVFGVCTDFHRMSATGFRAACPVICVGNLVAGGAGKTPIALAVADRLKKSGLSVHFLSRGYLGREKGPVRVDLDRHTARDVGDEPLLLAAHAPTWVSLNRSAGAAAASNGADVVIMDDGFQNGSVEKDLSIVVVDGIYGFGNGRVMPSGPLREPLAGGLARADLIILLGGSQSILKGSTSALPTVISARLKPAEDSTRYFGRRIVAFAGIGRPQKFFDTIREMGSDLIATHSFSDHHKYEPAELSALRAQASQENAELLTTEKDLVRIGRDNAEGISSLKICVAWQNTASLDAALAKKVHCG
jgi:tetraacyldisaccharide 4'-kinase